MKIEKFSTHESLEIKNLDSVVKFPKKMNWDYLRSSMGIMKMIQIVNIIQIYYHLILFRKIIFRINRKKFLYII